MNLNEFQQKYAYREEINYNGQMDLLARVVTEQKERYILQTINGSKPAVIKGKLRHEAISREDYPAVGDWVILQEKDSNDIVIIDKVLPRFSSIVRKVAGLKTDAQIVASNVTKVFIVISADEKLNERKLERYLTAVWESGASPCIIFSKVDLASDIDTNIEHADSIAFGIPIFKWNATTEEGKEDILANIHEDDSVVLIGSSGAGKSTLINALLTEKVLKTGSVREDDKRGRHTTTHRELFILPTGGVIIDTPGMRELQLWTEDGDTLSHTFSDINNLIAECRFTDCKHDTEPSCAVKEALQTGDLDEGRWNSYLKLQRELAYIERKQNAKLASEEKKKWKKISMQHKKKR
ncbi:MULTISPECIES: ribosome small subunit-dependent GTPase A [Oceanobacillus]|uniref:ribosome small subunit-dependent GTPase A n=1 Tax=Oceanobacillus TaxID=182709 RepID=UPI001BE9438E|nr:MULTISPECIES: ribosome small subunit-dependent GTPase A [Oceanobacillus]MBT2653068.1 ribosome small subunit-dependent GTPase A [Oceanobacillus sp. ISL-73]